MGMYYAKRYETAVSNSSYAAAARGYLTLNAVYIYENTTLDYPPYSFFDIF